MMKTTQHELILTQPPGKNAPFQIYFQYFILGVYFIEMSETAFSVASCVFSVMLNFREFWDEI